MPQKQSFCQFYTFWVRFTRVSGVKFCKKDVLVGCGKKLTLIGFAENQLICSLLPPNLFICFILYLSCFSSNCLFFALMPMVQSKYILTDLSKQGWQWLHPQTVGHRWDDPIVPLPTTIVMIILTFSIIIPNLRILDLEMASLFNPSLISIIINTVDNDPIVLLPPSIVMPVERKPLDGPRKKWAGTVFDIFYIWPTTFLLTRTICRRNKCNCAQRRPAEFATWRELQTELQTKQNNKTHTFFFLSTC